MGSSTRGGRLLSMAIAAGSLFWLAAAADGATGAKSLPKFPQIQAAVQRYFEGLPAHFPGRIITQSEVDPLLRALEKRGWTGLDRKKLLGRIPPDGCLLVRELSTPEGEKFMRRLGTYPTTYDQLDRLSAMPRGRTMVRVLIRSIDTNGDVTQWMFTTGKGKKMSRMMGESRMDDKKFVQPTGKIYTAAGLLAALKEAYDAAQRPPAKEASGGVSPAGVEKGRRQASRGLVPADK